MQDLLKSALRLHQAGQLEAAAGLYQTVLSKEPDNANALHLLGLLHHQRGDHVRAVELIGRAVALRPNAASFHANLAEAYRSLGQCERAIGSCRAAIVLRPELMEAHNNLGLALQGLDRHAEAIESLRKALALAPDFAPAHYNLGISLQELGQVDEALAHFHRAVALDPKSPLAQAKLGKLLLDAGRPEEALPHCREAVRLQPDQAALYHNLGLALKSLTHLADARSAFQEAIRLNPKLGRSYSQLGQILQQEGQLKEAETAFREALRVQPGYTVPHARLATLLRGKLPDADRAALESKLADPELGGIPRGRLLFALAHVLDSRGEFKRAADCLRQANTLNLKNAHRKRRGYDPSVHERFIDGLIQTFTPDFFTRLSDGGSDSNRPVFVVGLPRSGTTLIEQVLASHSRIHGAGELPLGGQTFANIPRALGRTETPLECLSHLGIEALGQLAAQHLEQLTQLGDSAERIVDKMPDNTLYLGFLAALFPRGIFIHSIRDLRDIAVSCWSPDFRSIPWANDLEHIRTRFQQYHRLMQHWRQVLPVPLHEFRYEDLVQDLERNARRLVQVCGLDWEPACLDFHRTKRLVRTASVTQVRQPIYTKSIGRWKNYEQELAHLFASLTDLIPDRGHAHQ